MWRTSDLVLWQLLLLSLVLDDEWGFELQVLLLLSPLLLLFSAPLVLLLRNTSAQALSSSWRSRTRQQRNQPVSAPASVPSPPPDVSPALGAPASSSSPPAPPSLPNIMKKNQTEMMKSPFNLHVQHPEFLVTSLWAFLACFSSNFFCFLAPIFTAGCAACSSASSSSTGSSSEIHRNFVTHSIVFTKRSVSCQSLSWGLHQTNRKLREFTLLWSLRPPVGHYSAQVPPPAGHPGSPLLRGPQWGRRCWDNIPLLLISWKQPTHPVPAQIVHIMATMTDNIGLYYKNCVCFNTRVHRKAI